MPPAVSVGAGAISAERPLLNHALVIYSCDQQLPECLTCRSPTQKAGRLARGGHRISLWTPVSFCGVAIKSGCLPR